MWGISEDHCCETCSYSRDEISTGSGRRWLTCALKQDSICEGQTLGRMEDMLALVDHNARCEEYDCDKARFQDIHGFDPDGYEAAAHEAARHKGDAPSWFV